MTLNTSSFFGILLVFLVTENTFAQPEEVPRDVLELRPDGYAYADYPGVFDNANRDGITIEAWIYLTDKPAILILDLDDFVV